MEYNVNYTLEEVPGVESRNVIIKAHLNDEESKYARFKNISKAGVTSTLIENGKEIEIEVENVELGVEKELKLKLIIENAPSGFTIKPSITVQEKTYLCGRRYYIW